MTELASTLRQPQKIPLHVIAITVLGLFAVLFLVLRILLYFPVDPALQENPEAIFAHASFGSANALKADARRALIIYVMVLYSMITVSFIGLAAVKSGKIEDPQDSYLVMYQTFWLFSPIVAALTARYGPDLALKLRRKSCGLLSWLFGPDFRCLGRCTGVDATYEDGGRLDRSYFLQFNFSWSRQWKPMLLAYVMPSFAGLFVLIMSSVTRMSTQSHKDYMQSEVFSQLGLDADMPEMMKWIVYIFYAVFLGPIWDLTCPESTDFGSSTGGPRVGTSWVLLAFCEEFGWAGLLFPAARHAFPGFRSFIYSWLLTSAIWVSWHVPFIIAGANSLNNTIIPEVTEYHPGAPNLLPYAPYTDDSPTPLWWGLIGFTLDLFMARLCICILTTINKAGIFPAILFHAGHNMLIESFMAQVLRPSTFRPRRARIYAYFVGESGIFQIMAYVLCAIMLYRWKRHRMPPLHLLPANLDEPLASNRQDEPEVQQEGGLMQDGHTGPSLEVGHQSSYRGQGAEMWPPTEAVRPM